jgi:hypothetical protein
MKCETVIVTYADSNVQLNEAEGARTKFKLPQLSPNGFHRNKKARHRRPTAHARARYRCFLPDLAGLAGMRRAGPMPDLFDFSIPIVLFPFPPKSPTMDEANI